MYYVCINIRTHVRYKNAPKHPIRVRDETSRTCRFGKGIPSLEHSLTYHRFVM